MNRFTTLRSKRIEDALKMKDDEEKVHLTFQPCITPSKRAATPTKASKPVYERLSAPTERTLEGDPELTFQPKLGAYILWNHIRCIMLHYSSI
jgi:hypothetical protein